MMRISYDSGGHPHGALFVSDAEVLGDAGTFEG